jgi:hypothetical protein
MTPASVRWWDDRRVIDATPWATLLLLESANVAQLVRMWSVRSAEGQSVPGWLSVTVALLLWANYYRVTRQRTALLSTLVGVVMNLLVVSSVLYFQHR